jgi:hypothetical protein
VNGSNWPTAGADDRPPAGSLIPMRVVKTERQQIGAP